jgi:hypothetical protein
MEQDVNSDEIVSLEKTYEEPMDKEVFSLAHFLSALVSREEIQKIGTSSIGGEQHPKVDIFKHFSDINIQNSQANKQIYPQTWKKDQPQPKLLSIVDLKEGLLKIVVLEPIS